MNNDVLVWLMVKAKNKDGNVELVPNYICDTDICDAIFQLAQQNDGFYIQGFGKFSYKQIRIEKGYEYTIVFRASKSLRSFVSSCDKAELRLRFPEILLQYLDHTSSVYTIQQNLDNFFRKIAQKLCHEKLAVIKGLGIFRTDENIENPLVKNITFSLGRAIN